MSARELALRVINEWDEARHVYLERILGDALAACDLEARDRRFVMALAGGVVRHRNTLGAISELFVHGPLPRLSRTLRNAVALGLFQRVYLDTPDHALVDETIGAWVRGFGEREHPADRPRLVGLLNGVLRNACRQIEIAGTDPQLLDDPDTVWGAGHWVRVPGLGLPSRAVNLPQMLAIKFSHTADMIRMWLERFDESRLLEILRWNDVPPPFFLVLRSDVHREHYERRLKILSHEVEETPDAQTLHLEQPGMVDRLPGYTAGEFWVQDLNARRLAQLLPTGGDALLDLCAAPGGKLMCLLDRESFRAVVACDVNARRLDTVRENLERLRFDLESVRFIEVPADSSQVKFPGSFDRVLLDVPCSNTGVLSRRHEARWRFLPENQRRLHKTQLGLLRLGAGHLKPGGFMLYTTCSIEPNENSQMIQDFLQGSTELQLIREVEYLPGDERGDGGYGALLRRRP